jgi:hypothetical protein
VEVERAAVSAGARLVSAAGEGNGDSLADAFMRIVIDSAAQYEHGLIRARTLAALAAKRARGERVGAVPYGFALDRDGVRLVAAEREQAAIARARELRAIGLSLRAVALRLAVEGHVQPHGASLLPVPGRANAYHHVRPHERPVLVAAELQASRAIAPPTTSRRRLPRTPPPGSRR